MINVEFHVTPDVCLRGSQWGSYPSAPVILGHGGGQTRHSWRQTAERLAEAGWRVVAFDLRGHGESTWSPDGEYSMEVFGEDLLAVARSFEQPPAVVGASLSGLAGLIAEGQLAPGSFRSLTLVDIAPRMDPFGVMKIIGFMSAYIEQGFESIEDAAKVVSAYMSQRKNPPTVDSLARSMRKDPDGRYRWHWDPAFIRNIPKSGDDSRFARLDAMAATLRLPVQLIRGRMSELVTEQAVSAFLELVPHARFDDITGAGHMVVGDRNDAFTDAVIEFLGVPP